MREIKFRQEDGCGGWHYWGYINGTFISPLTSDKRGKSYQFTGLLDKNGKDIYEGDIVNESYNNITMEIIDTVQAHSWLRDNGSLDYTDKIDWGATAYRYEIIGNIYQNKELLK